MKSSDLVCFLVLMLISSAAQAEGPADLKSRLLSLQTLISRGDNDQALPELEKLEKEVPRDAAVQAMLGRAYLMKGQASEAKTHSERAFAANPKNSDAMNNFAALALNNNDAGAAEKWLLQAETLGDKNPRTSYNLGLLAQKVGAYPQAVARYEETIRLDPNYAFAYLNLSNVYEDVGNCEKGVVAAKRAAELMPKSSAPFLNMGVCYRKLKQLDAAEAAYKKGAALSPNDPQYPYNLGFVYDDMNRPLEAEKSYLEAIRIAPGFVRPYVNLGIVYKHLSRYEDAVKILEKGKTIAPQLYNIRSELVKVYRLKGDRESAMRELAEAQSIDPQRAAKLQKD